MSAVHGPCVRHSNDITQPEDDEIKFIQGMPDMLLVKRTNLYVKRVHKIYQMFWMCTVTGIKNAMVCFYLSLCFLSPIVSIFVFTEGVSVLSIVHSPEHSFSWRQRLGSRT